LRHPPSCVSTYLSAMTPNVGFGRPTFGGAAAPLNLVDFFPSFDVALTRGEVGFAGHRGHARGGWRCADTRQPEPPGTYAELRRRMGGQRGPLILFRRAASFLVRTACCRLTAACARL
jgi:hypothetical protein